MADRKREARGTAPSRGGAETRRTEDRKRKAREVFYIVNWAYHEHHKMNSLRSVSWVKAKIEWGEDWLKLMELEERAEAILAWEIVRGLAAQSPYRGMLLREGHRIEPHTIRTMAMLTAAPEEQLSVGLRALEVHVGWVRRRAWRASPGTMSRRIYGQVFSKFDVSGRDSDAKRTPNGRDFSAKQAPSHSHIHSPSPGELINPPLPPKTEARSERREAKSDPNGNGGELEIAWGNGSWGIVEALASKGHIERGYVPWMRKRTPDLTPWPFKDVVAHFVDVTKARKRPKSMDQVFSWVFYRLREGKAPSAKNRRVVEGFLRYG